MHDRKREVLQKALDLFAKKGITETSVQDIIRAADISKGTFYNYFPSKNACIISIMEMVQSETIAARNELLIGAEASSVDVLIKQVEVRMQTNDKYSLFSIFQSVFHSKDKKLIAFIKKFQQTELAWLTRRLIKVFGKEVTPYATDCAVLFYGMLQHLMSIWSFNTKGKVDTTRITQYAMRRLEAIIEDVITREDRLLGEEIFLHPKGKNTRLTKGEILERLIQFDQMLPDDVDIRKKQFVQFLIEEFRRDAPRTFIVEPIIQSFRKEFTDTIYESDTQPLSVHIWQYIQRTQK